MFFVARTQKTDPDPPDTGSRFKLKRFLDLTPIRRGHRRRRNLEASVSGSVGPIYRAWRKFLIDLALEKFEHSLAFAFRQRSEKFVDEFLFVERLFADDCHKHLVDLDPQTLQVHGTVKTVLAPGALHLNEQIVAGGHGHGRG